MSNFYKKMATVAIMGSLLGTMTALPFITSADYTTPSPSTGTGNTNTSGDMNGGTSTFSQQNTGSNNPIVNTEIQNIADSLREIRGSITKIFMATTPDERNQLVRAAVDKLANLRMRLAAVEDNNSLGIMPAITRFVSALAGSDIPESVVKSRLMDAWDRLQMRTGNGPVLAPGSTGVPVTFLQSVLKTDPSIYPEGLVTGFYGPLTQAAVTRFQTRYNLAATGSLDKQTLEIMFRIYKGAIEDQVMHLKSQINL